MSKTKVLFLCVHNSARSQMAEAYLKQLAGDTFEVESAGLEPGKLNPLVVEAMKEEGIDISGNQTKDVFDLFRQGRMFRYVITVCDAKAAESCPIFPGMMYKINWSFADPSRFVGSHEEKLQQIRQVRDLIKESILGFIDQYKNE